DVVAVLQNNEEKEHDSSDTSVAPTTPLRPPTSDSEHAVKPKSIPKTLNLGRCTVTECNVDLERHNARQFVKTVQNSLLPKLLNLRTSIEVDEAMQEFASRCCQHNATQPPATACVMNADGVYLATYAALLLTLRQRRAHTD
ncbi:hypothetical protein ACJJTC_011378, partial [Scirpophaga incertulas]